MLNVVTFEKFNSLSFGRLIAEGGLDSKKDEGRLKPRYDGSAEIGLFSPELRLGAMIQSGNLNDYSSMKASGGESRNEFGYVSLDRNFSRNKMICVDYNYSAQRYDDEQRVVTDYYPTEDFASQTNSSKNMSASRGANHDIKIRYENTSGKSSLRANLDMAFSKNAMLSESLSSVERDGSYMLSNKQYYNVSSFGYTLNPYLYYSRKAGENSYSIRGSFVYSNNNGSTVRRDTLEEVGARRLLGLSIDRGRPKISGSSRFEWIWNMKKGNISPNIKVSYSSGTESEMAVDLDSGEKNTYYSGDMDVSETVISPEISGVYSLNSKTRLSFDLAYKMTMFNLNERLPYERTVKKFFHALEPRIAYYWKHGEISGLTVRIDGLQSIGSYRNYGEWINDSNPMFITTGNPELRPSTSYSLSLSERIMTKKSFSVTFVGRVSPVFNPVITDRTYYRDGGQIEAFPGYEVSSGATVSTFVNGSMAWNYALGVELESNIVPLSSILKFKADYNYRESETSVNSVIGNESSHALLSDLGFSTNFSSKFRLDLTNKFEYRVYINSSAFRNGSYYDRASAKMRWDFSKRVNLECSYDYEYYLSGTGADPLSNHLLNASLGVFLFKDRNARLSFNANDILNSRNFVTTTYADQYVMNTYSRIQTGSYMISFEIRFGNQLRW